MALDDIAAVSSETVEETSVGNGDVSTGADSGTAVETLPAEGTEQVTEQTESTEEVPLETPTEEQLPAGPTTALPKELRSLMADKELMANPTIAAAVKNIQSTYDRLAAYAGHFPTVADAKKFTEAFPGGVQDALDAQAKAADFDNSNEVFYSHDPKASRDLAASWQSDDPDGYRVLMQSGLETYAERDPEGYRQLGLTVLEHTLDEMQSAAFRRNDQESAQAISKTHEAIFGRKPGEAQRTDPRDAKYAERERSMQQREQRFTEGVVSNFIQASDKVVSDRFSTAIRTMVGQVLKNVKVSEAQKERLSEDIYNDINAKLKQDRSVLAQVTSIITAGKRAGNFTEQDQQRYTNALYAKANALLRSVGPQFINNWTATFLNMKRADTTKRENAARRTDITGGGSPNLGVGTLTGDKMLDMSNAEINSWKGPISPNWKQEMRDAKSKRLAG